MTLSKTSILLLGVGILSLSLLGPTQNAQAVPILVFGQNGTALTITATTNPANTETTITATNVEVTITGLDPAFGIGTSGITAFFNFNVVSTGPASTVGSDITQNFGTMATPGTFSFYTGVGMTGTNILSGTFVDAVFGSGTGLTLTASDGTPGEFVAFNSDLVPEFVSPLSINLAFAGVNPPAAIVGTTLRGFQSSVGGDFSAEAIVPEPGTIAMALSALPLMGCVAGYRRWRRREQV